MAGSIAAGANSVGEAASLVVAVADSAAVADAVADRPASGRHAGQRLVGDRASRYPLRCQLRAAEMRVIACAADVSGLRGILLDAAERTAPAASKEASRHSSDTGRIDRRCRIRRILGIARSGGTRC